MSFDLCSSCHNHNSNIQQKCPKHPQLYFEYFCAKTGCLELLCTSCVRQHQQTHQNLKLTQEKICKLSEVEQFYQKKIQAEIEYEQARSKIKNFNQILQPCEVVCQLVDEYFNGTVKNKMQNLQAHKKIIQNPSARRFVEIIEHSSQYRVDSDFKQKYFKFLDSLTGADHCV